MTLPTSLARVRHLVSARWISLRLVRRNAGRIPLFSLLLALLLVGITASDVAKNGLGSSRGGVDVGLESRGVLVRHVEFYSELF